MFLLLLLLVSSNTVSAAPPASGAPPPPPKADAEFELASAADADNSWLKAALQADVKGIFYSGGGYVSHAEGLALTWGWFHFFQKWRNVGSIAEMFSNKIVGTNSGGGWFFNDLLYSQEWNNIVTTPNPDNMIKGAMDFYTDLIAHIYSGDSPGSVTKDEVISKTKAKTWSALSAQDWTTMYTFMHSWENLVTSFHYTYSEKPVMNVKNLKWRSQFCILQQYETSPAYYFSTGIKAFSDSRRGTWYGSEDYPIIPAEYQFDFTDGTANPAISVSIPSLDDWFTAICSMRKTERKCEKDDDCMENAFCDEKVKKCFCDAGFSSIENGQQNVNGICIDCSTVANSKVGQTAGEAFKGADDIEMFYDKHYGTWGDVKKTMKVDYLKTLIKEAIDDSPKHYSGPSSAALAMNTGSSDAVRIAMKLNRIEAAWRTPPMTDLFGSGAPTIALADGGAVDNCGLIAIVREMQKSINLKPGDKIWGSGSGISETLLGMCSTSDMALNINNMNADGTMGEEERSAVYYPVFTLTEKPKLQFSGEVMEVWGLKVKTLYEPINGILPDSTFTIFAFRYPMDAARQVKGLCRNMGLASFVGTDGMYGNCPYNYDEKNPLDYHPLLSLLLGQGESFEIQISLTKSVNDMTKLGEELGLFTSNTLPHWLHKEFLADVHPLSLLALLRAYFSGSDGLINAFALIGVVSLTYMAAKTVYDLKMRENYSSLV